MELILSNQIPIGLQAISTYEDYYTDHGIGHVQRVISKRESLDQFLCPPINQKEAFVLLVAVYFHDIGMFLGRRELEDPRQVRAEHHTRSAEIIQWLNDEHYLDIDDLELRIIKKIVEAHRVTDLQQLAENQRIEGTDIRTRLLGALLRIADSCDCDRSRAPKAIFDLFYEHIPPGSRQYWQVHFPVTDVSFNAGRASIVVSADLNTDLKQKIEKHRIGNLMKKELKYELESVVEVFRLNNIPLVRVEIQDFDQGEWVDFSSLPGYEDIITITLRSNFQKVDQLVNTIAEFASSTSNGIPLVIEIRPPEGPIYIDTGISIESNRLEEISSRLREVLGPDLWLVSGNLVEKMTIRRGMAN